MAVPFFSPFSLAGGKGGLSLSSSNESGRGDTNSDFWNDLQGGDASTGGSASWMPYVVAGAALLLAYKVMNK